jgi:hypothetical protein
MLQTLGFGDRLEYNSLFCIRFAELLRIFSRLSDLQFCRNSTVFDRGCPFAARLHMSATFFTLNMKSGEPSFLVAHASA